MTGTCEEWQQKYQAAVNDNQVTSPPLSRTALGTPPRSWPTTIGSTCPGRAGHELV
jgi:hypothetical protein